MQIYGSSNRDNHLYPLHNNSLVYLKTTTTYVRALGESPMQCGVGGQCHTTSAVSDLLWDPPKCFQGPPWWWFI